MKKLLIRICGALCILASILVLFLPTWVTVEDVSRKDIREYRDELKTDLETVEELLIQELSLSPSALKEDLKDNDLPSTKSGIKKRMKETETIVEELFDKNISLKEVFTISSKAPQYIRDTNNMLSTSVCKELIFENTLINQDYVQSFVDDVADFSGIFTLVTILFVILIILGLAATVTHCLNKVRYLKYIFMSLLIIIVVGISFGIPVLNEMIQSGLELDPRFEDMALCATAMPYICVALTIVPVVLDSIFETKNKKKVEAYK